MNTDFLNEELSKDQVIEFGLEEALHKIEEINGMMSKMNTNALDSINRRLATGNCYFKDEILFERRKDGDVAIYFPKGNAVEYQVANGTMPESFLINKEKLENLINKDKKPDSST